MMKSLERQVGGTHYKTEGIEPAEYNLENFGPEWIQGNIVKYITRYRNKGGIKDLLKIKHYVDILLEFEYDCDPDGVPYPDQYDLDGDPLEATSSNAPPDWDKSCAITKQEIDEMKDKVDYSKRLRWVDTFDDLLMMQLSEMPSAIDLFDAMVVTHDDCNGECKKD